MASDLISIGKSGANAARASLEVSAQNIANAATQGYVKRTVQIAEVASVSTTAGSRDVSLSGARIGGILRQADVFRQAEVRRTSSDLARADAELIGLENIELAIENAGIFDAIVGYESALRQLAGDTVNPSLRASVLESARTLASGLNVAASQLENVKEKLQFEAADGITQVNRQLKDLSILNVKIVRTTAGSGNRAVLLDQRDELLQSIGARAGITARIGIDESVEVRIAGTSGTSLVSGSAYRELEQSVNGDGTLSFRVGGSLTSIASGALAGKAQALTAVAGIESRLDSLANSIASTANAAQTGGVDNEGRAGEPMFSGSDAGSIAVALRDGSQIATAPPGAPARSLDGSNLASLRRAIADEGLAEISNSLLFDVSSTVAGRRVTQGALGAIARAANDAFNEQSSVDLDQEAANLVRYQQAFQASARIIQVASAIFDTLLSTR